MTQPTDQLIDRRSIDDRRRGDDDARERERGRDPIAAWRLHIPPHLLEVRSTDPWTQVVHRSLVAEHEGEHDDGSRSWDEAVAWQIAGHDPTTPDQSGPRPAPVPDGREAFRGGVHVGPEAVLAFHRELGRLSDWTFAQELISVEGSRGPIVAAHLRTTATRGGRVLDTPTLVVFELSCLRVRRVTEIPGDLTAWDAFWGA